MKYSLAYLAAVLSCGVAAAQEAQPAKTGECCDAFKLDLTTNASLYSFESNDVVAVSETFSFVVDDKLTFDVVVPFYNDGNETGVSDVDFVVSYDLYKGEFLSGNVGLNGVFGVKVPLDGEFSSGGETFHVGAVGDIVWGDIVLSQTFDYLFVNDYTYTPIFNGFVYDDVFGGVTTLSYKVNEGMLFCVNATQQYSNDFNALLVGPSVAWSFKNIDAHVGVDFPVDYSVKAENLDCVISAGLTINF